MSVSKTLIIAEIGVNHGGNVMTALKLIRSASAAGADVAKFQAFTPAIVAPGNYERQATLKGLALTRDELIMCKAECDHVGIEFGCTPMDTYWLDVCVRDLHVKRIKIGSGQATNRDLVDGAARTGLPILISNGMALNNEFAQAVDEWLYDAVDVTVMSCKSEYPTAEEGISMETLETLRGMYPERKIGFSSHCPRWWASVAAVYAGAACIEQHICDPLHLSGPDISSSLLPVQFRKMVSEIRYAESRRSAA